jgi:hypothetical protein
MNKPAVWQPIFIADTDDVGGLLPMGAKTSTAAGL